MDQDLPLLLGVIAHNTLLPLSLALSLECSCGLHVLRVRYMPGTVLSIFQALRHLNLVVLSGGYFS